MDVDSAFPVGTVIYRADEISPATYLGGTWQKIAQGEVIIGASPAFPLNEEGGEAMHTFTIDEMPAHNHIMSMGSEGSFSTSDGWFQGVSLKKIEQLGITASTGGSQPHNNMQPYVAKNIWQRIA